MDLRLLVRSDFVGDFARPAVFPSLFALAWLFVHLVGREKLFLANWLGVLEIR